MVKKATYVRGPVKQDDCYACHDPHGSNYTKILKKAFPTEFYMPYATENYAICFDCHNRDISIDRFTTTLRSFRYSFTCRTVSSAKLHGHFLLAAVEGRLSHSGEW